MKRSLLIIFLILVADQALKFWIKTSMSLGQEIHLFGDWFILHFTENEGMAFGMKFGGDKGKLVLSVFRIVAVAVIGVYLHGLIARKASKGLIVSIALIFAGALGNIIDSAFYGLVFSASDYYHTASFLPQGGGYGDFLHGKVVDMFYFPLIEGVYPQWIPWKGGQEFIFFRPVFNLADAAISVGVFWLLLFQKRYFGKERLVG